MRRLRQVALATLDRDRVVRDLRAVLGLEVGFEDPAIAQLGLHNAVLPIGDQFLEVVAPIVTDTTAERYVHRRGGDTGYMLIFQTDEHPLHTRAIDELGVRVVARFDAPGFTDVQLHPADTGGAFIEIDQNDPPEEWHPAGSNWRPAVRTEVVTGIASAQISCADPHTVASRWGRLLATDLLGDESAPTLRLDDAELRFRPITDDRGEGITGIEVRAADPDALRERAARHGMPIDPAGSVHLGGITITAIAAAR